MGFEKRVIFVRSRTKWILILSAIGVVAAGFVATRLISGYYFRRGNANFKAEKYKEAIEDYTESLWWGSERYEAYLNRGAAFHNIGKQEEAIRDSTVAIGMNPREAMEILDEVGYRGTVVCASRLGLMDQSIVYGQLRNLLEIEDSYWGPPPHCLVITAQLHFKEEEFLQMFYWKGEGENDE